MGQNTLKKGEKQAKRAHFAPFLRKSSHILESYRDHIEVNPDHIEVIIENNRVQCRPL